MDKKVSVIMSAYREPISIINESIESILKQTYSNIELILVLDEPDRDDVLKLIKSKNDKRIKIIKNERNLGLTASLNIGIDNAKGDYIARMDADDISMPERIENQLRELTKRSLDLIGCNIINVDFDGNMAKNATVYPTDSNLAGKMMKYNSPLAHPTWLGKASLFKDNRYIDYLACEDYEFLTRAVLKGYKIGNVSIPLLYYRINTSGISHSKKSLQKISLYYVRKEYRRRRICDYGDYLAYIKSPRGERKRKSIEKYYSTLENAKKYRNNNIIKYLGCMASLIFNKSTLDIAYSSAMTRRIRKRIKNGD